MQVQLLFPTPGPLALEELKAQVSGATVNRPFDAGVVEACIELSQRLLRDPGARRYPELLALGFWMRKTELHRLRQQFDLLQRDDRLLVPCGTVFRSAPAKCRHDVRIFLAALGTNRQLQRDPAFPAALRIHRCASAVL